MNITYYKDNLKKLNYINNIFVFSLLYLSNSMFMQESVAGRIRLMMLLGISLFFLLVNKVRLTMNKKSIMVFLFLLIVQLFSMFLYGVDFEFGIGNIITLITAFIVTSILSFDKFIESYRKVMYFICGFSLLAFIAFQITPQIFNVFPSYVWHNNIYFKNLLFCIIPYSMQYTRNFGIFVEPGMFQIFINYAIIIELFYMKQLNITYLIVYILTIITTKSTNGFIVLFIIMMAFSFKNKSMNLKNKRINKKITLIFIVTIFICLVLAKNVPYFTYVFLKVQEIWSNQGDKLGSGGERWRAFLYALDLYKSNPILGSGVIKFNNYNSDIIKTFTPLNWCAIYGSVYGILCNYLYMIQVKKIKDNIFVKIMITIALFLMISTQAMQSNIFCILLIIYSTQLKEKNSIKIKFTSKVLV